LKKLFYLVVGMFILFVVSMSSESEYTVLIALGFVVSFMLALVSLATDLWPDSDLLLNGTQE